jgi:hypothetical protein
LFRYTTIASDFRLVETPPEALQNLTSIDQTDNMSAEVAAPIAFPTTSPRRLQRGTRYTAIPENTAGSSQQPPPPSLYNLDSAFQLQEYIAQLVKRDPFDIEAIVRLPSGQTSQQEQNDPSSSSNAQDVPDVDQNCWVYEHLRRLAQDLTYPLITLLQTECTRQSCPEMKAGEWLYLCVAHGNGGSMEVRYPSRVTLSIDG